MLISDSRMDISGLQLLCLKVGGGERSEEVLCGSLLTVSLMLIAGVATTIIPMIQTTGYHHRLLLQ